MDLGEGVETLASQGNSHGRILVFGLVYSACGALPKGGIGREELGETGDVGLACIWDSELVSCPFTGQQVTVALLWSTSDQISANLVRGRPSSATVT